MGYAFENITLSVQNKNSGCVTKTFLPLEDAHLMAMHRNPRLGLIVYSYDKLCDFSGLGLFQ